MVNHDTHGEPANPRSGSEHSYKKGRAVAGDEGIIQAAFDGNHGWFWRNRTDKDVTITLRVNGEYAVLMEVKQDGPAYPSSGGRTLRNMTSRRRS